MGYWAKAWCKELPFSPDFVAHNLLAIRTWRYPPRSTIAHSWFRLELSSCWSFVDYVFFFFVSFSFRCLCFLYDLALFDLDDFDYVGHFLALTCWWLSNFPIKKKKNHSRCTPKTNAWPHPKKKKKLLLGWFKWFDNFF